MDKAELDTDKYKISPVKSKAITQENFRRNQEMEEEIIVVNGIGTIFNTESSLLDGGNKITQEDIRENFKLELSEFEGNILGEKTIIINAGGIENGGLRNVIDGNSYFGFVEQKNGNIINDFILNNQDNLGIDLTTAFIINFDKQNKEYFLSPASDDDESIVFVRLDNLLKITRKQIISLGEIHFSVEVDPDDFALKIELAFGNEETKSKIFPIDLYQTVKIGRNRDNDLVLENYAYSRIQTSFIFNLLENAWYVQDGFDNKKSTNGTWLYLDSPWKIEDIAYFRIGSNFLVIKKFK